MTTARVDPPRILIGILWFFACSPAFAQTLPEPGSFTPQELLAQASAAYQSGDFPKAEVLFLAFERDFEGEPQLEETLLRNKALLALCMIANGRPGEAVPYIEASLVQPDLPPDVREELSFWLAIQRMQEGDYRGAQEKFGEFFKQSSFSLTRRQEALVLFGTCYVLQEYYVTAAEFFAHQIPKLRESPGGTEFAGRAAVLQLLALSESGKLDEALKLIRAEFANLDEISQIISFQTLALQIGSQFMEQKRFHDAIACLQRIWPREKLLAHQKQKLTDLQSRRTLLAKDPRRQSAVFQLDGIIQRVEREITSFQAIADFDAALRLRLALAFQGLERYREAALIMEEMLKRMDPTPTVQSAAFAVIQCWSQLERWPRAIQAAENYLVVFGDDPTNKRLTQVLFMQADALMQMQRHEEASAIFETIATSFPDDPLRPKALFMAGFSLLLQDFHDSAISLFDVVLEEHADDPMEQNAFYWKGMALSFLQEYETTRQHMSDYLSRYQESGATYESEAVFRIAYSTFCLADYETSITQFQEFLDQYGDEAPDVDEARLLLGDALLGVGRSDEGIAAYQAINPESQRFFEDGFFKIGKAYKLLEDLPRMRAHYEEFLTTYPDSLRMPEAVYWIGWSHVQEQNLELAKQVYSQTVRQHGDDPALFAMEELLLALPKVYKREGPEGTRTLQRELQKLHLEAKDQKKDTLALRALWAEAHLVRPQNESLSRGLFVRTASLIDPKIHNPQIVADAADAALASGTLQIAETMYRELRRWNPVSYHKARAYKGLGMVAAQQKDYDKALRLFDRYIRDMQGSLDLPEVILEKSRILIAQENYEAARSALEDLLAQSAATSRHKAETLLALGDLLTKQNQPSLAVAYYERLYVAYGKYLPLVAQAYYRRGEALEALREPGKAYEVYQELQQRQDLESFPEARLARQKLEALKAHAPTEEREPQTGTEDPS